MAALAFLALSGCETIVDVDTPPHTPRLALSYTLSNQPATADYNFFFQNRALFVSGSQGVLETKRVEGRADASVQLFDETGRVVEQFRSKRRAGGYNSSTGQPDSVGGYYVPTRGFVGEPGRMYTLRASAPGLEAVESALTLPEQAVIETGSFVAGQSNPNTYGRRGRLTCSILDNAGATDYYLAYARLLDRNGNYWGDVRPDYSIGGDGPDISVNRFQLSESSNSYGQYPFSDAGSNGQRLSFSADVLLQYRGGSSTTREAAYIELIVSSITPDTYRFYQSLQRYYDTDGNPFAEPAPLYSNVRPGYGLFGGATDAVYRIAL